MIRPIRNLQKKFKKSDSEYGSAHQFCVLLVDTSSLAILSSFCNVYDILDEGVTGKQSWSFSSICSAHKLTLYCLVIEDVGKKRQAMPQLEAIYFISPTINSINSLCEDFEDASNPHYEAVHVFFTIPISLLYQYNILF
jgi:syntaxin-binding protein 1